MVIDTETKKVKVRIKVGTVPYLGFVDVPPPITRVSDILNSNDVFLLLKDVSSLEPVGQNSILLISKKEISYIQALEEFKSSVNVNTGAIGFFTKVKILLRDVNLKISGQLFIPYKEENIANTANKANFFLNIKDVTVEGTREIYSFLAVSKSFIKTIESDGKPV